jgi:hypothetical protein
VVGGELGVEAEVAQAVAKRERRLEVLLVLDHGPAVVLGRSHVELRAALEEAR